MAQQIKKKFIGNDQVDGTKVKLLHGQTLRGTDANGNEIDILSDLESQIAQVQAEVDAEEILRASEDVRVLNESKEYTDQEVLAEEQRAMAAEAALQLEIDAEEVLRASEDVRILDEAKAYTDSSIAVLTNMAPEAYDTFKEIADYISQDQSGAAEIISQLAEHESRLDAAESADQALQDQLNSQQTQIDGKVSKAGDSITGELSFPEDIPGAGTSSRINRDGLFASYSSQSVESLLEGDIRYSDSSLFEADRAQIISEVQQSMNGQVYTTRSYNSRIEDTGLRVNIQQTNLSLNENNEVVPTDLEALRLRSSFYSDTNDLQLRLYKISQEDGSNIPIMPSLPESLTTKAFVDQEVETEETRAMAAETQLQSEIDAEETRAIAAEQGIQTLLDDEISRAMGEEQALGQRIDSVELSSSSLQSQIDTERERIDAVLFAADADKDNFVEIVQLINSIDTENDNAFAGYVTSNNQAVSDLTSRVETTEQEIDSLQTEQFTLQASIESEEERASAVESSLQLQISAEESRASASEAQLASQISTTQTQLQSFESSLQSIQDAMNQTESEVQTLNFSISSLQSKTSIVESEISSLNQEVEQLQSSIQTWKKQTFEMTTVLTHVDLETEALTNSLVVFVGRLAVHKDIDYTVSVVNQKTRLTFINDFAAEGIEGVEAGDFIFVTYAS